MSQETVRHVLAVAVRLDDHFLGTPIPDEVDVRIDDEVQPGRVRGGAGRRHHDGTYRFVDLADGVHAIEVGGLAERWMALDPEPTVVLPLANPAEALVIQLWPTPSQTTPLGVTSVRGKLVGGPAQTIGRRVEIDIGATASLHRTSSSSLAEFLFLLPGNLELDLDGRVPITIRVAGVTVSGGEVVEGEQRTAFTGASIAIAPGRETRVRVHVT